MATRRADPMPEHGIYLPGAEVATFEDWEREADPAEPTVAVLFYRAHRMSGNTASSTSLRKRCRARA
jgi:cobaltochelatase CobN